MHNTRTLRVYVYPSCFLPSAMSLIMEKSNIESMSFISRHCVGKFISIPVLRSWTVCGIVVLSDYINPSLPCFYFYRILNTSVKPCRRLL